MCNIRNYKSSQTLTSSALDIVQTPRSQSVISSCQPHLHPTPPFVRLSTRQVRKRSVEIQGSHSAEKVIAKFNAQHSLALFALGPREKAAIDVRTTS